MIRSLIVGSVYLYRCSQKVGAFPGVMVASGSSPGAILRSASMYALAAKAAIFRSARRLLPVLAAILIPANVLSY
jgi:predicted NAD-dependent protein-ADP-ribosyltransferase YbiA (DUF1768 family)